MVGADPWEKTPVYKSVASVFLKYVSKLEIMRIFRKTLRRLIEIISPKIMQPHPCLTKTQETL